MLLVNEIFGPTIQGEGKSSGKEVVFLRLSGCNLACVWCDTPYTWNWKSTKFAHPEKYDKKLEAHRMTVDQVCTSLKRQAPTVKSVVISGGEPFLQQRELVQVMKVLKQEGYWFEVETNGTIAPTEEFLELIDQINCSPKLANSGPDNPLKKRQVPGPLQALSQCEKTSFKFVATNDQDIPEILDLVSRYQMQDVYLMPEGRTKPEQEARQDSIAKLSAEYGFKFSPRLHVLKWGAKRAV